MASVASGPGFPEAAVSWNAVLTCGSVVQGLSGKLLFVKEVRQLSGCTLGGARPVLCSALAPRVREPCNCALSLILRSGS